MAKSKYLDYKDYIVSVFVDNDKCLSVFVNDRGETRVINFEDWAVCNEDYVIAYNDLLVDSFKGCRGYISDQDKDEMAGMLQKYFKHIKKQVGNDYEWDYDYLERYGVVL